jgi:CDP-6-deoxy-D-xylo-4-hexulose-3-dehydrase
MSDSESLLTERVFADIKRIFFLREAKSEFVPGQTLVRYAGAVYDHEEVNAMVAAILNGWFGLGARAEEFETELAAHLGAAGGVLTNSGSSASLLAVAGLMSPALPDRLRPGDEIIAPACCFPTTINPSIVLGLTPVFIDIVPGTYTIDVDDLLRALSAATRAIIVHHTLGNPNEMAPIMEFAQRRNLFVIEDNCGTIGSEYDGRKTGSFGDLAFESFYPAHHLTIGEGGMALYNDERFARPLRSLRDWGRACFCRGDEQATLGACGQRFSHAIDGRAYDHKYLYSEIGYNLKPVEFQAAMGLAQLKKLPAFLAQRARNFARLHARLADLADVFILPESLPAAKASWFAFPLTIRAGAPFDRSAVTTFLEDRRIQTRPLLAGNILRHPAYRETRCRVVGELTNSDYLLHHAFFVGIYPGLGDREMDYIADVLQEFVQQRRK